MCPKKSSPKKRRAAKLYCRKYLFCSIIVFFSQTMGSSVWRIRDISVRNRIPFYSKSDPDPTIILSRIQIHSKHSTSYCPFVNIFIEATSNSMLQHLGRVRFNFILMLNHLAWGSSPAPDPANQFKQNRKNFKTPELGARLQNNVASRH